MRKINKSVLDENTKRKLSEFESNFSSVKTPNNYKDPEVQKICLKYHDDSVYQNLKEQLKKDQKVGIHSCCCYCECVCGDGDWNDLEHVKPKSKFPQDALKWENMLLACNTCNRSDKNDMYEDGFLNLSSPSYVFEDHFEYWEKNHFIISPKSREGRITLKCLNEFKFNNYTHQSRYEIFEKITERILKEKEKGKEKPEIIIELEDFIETLGKNYTFSKRLISKDKNSPLYNELYG